MCALLTFKLVLVNPPVTPQQRYGALAKGGVYMPPLGLGYVAAVLAGQGFAVSIVDCEALRLDAAAAARRVLAEKPDCVGITACTMTVNNAAAFAFSLKSLRPDVPVVIGGPHITAVAEETMRECACFDIAVLGEGERTIVELASALRERAGIDAVAGIVFRSGGGLRCTAARDLIADLDSIPFPRWDLYPLITRYYRPAVFAFKRLPSFSAITSRGCPSACSFCNQSPWGKGYREHSAEYVLDMLQELTRRYGIKDVAFYDGTFGVNKGRLVRLCELLIDRRLDLSWSCNLRATMADAALLEMMKAAGCWQIAYGVESGSQQVLDFIRKGITTERVMEAVNLTRRAGIVSKGYIMLGTLIETEQTCRQTLDFVTRLPLDLLTVNHFTPYPGTLDYTRAEQYGYFDRDPQGLNEHNLAFVPFGLSPEKLEGFITRITRAFYLRPRIFWNFLAIAAANLSSARLICAGFAAFLSFQFRTARNWWLKWVRKVPRGRIYFSGSLFRTALKEIFAGRMQDERPIEDFESAFARYIGAEHALAVYSGTQALCLILEALNIREGDEIIVPGYMVGEVVTVIREYKAVPVFIDCAAGTCAIDPALIERRITGKTKAMLLAHMHGFACAADALIAAARKLALPVIEDCAQACGAEYRGKKVGTNGDIAYFSFGVMKNLNTFGGGMIVTDNASLAGSIRSRIKAYAYPARSELLKKLLVCFILYAATRQVFFSLVVYPVLRLTGVLCESFLCRWFRGNNPRDRDMRGIRHAALRRRYSGAQAKVGMRQLETVDIHARERRNNLAALLPYLRAARLCVVCSPEALRGSVVSNLPVAVPDPQAVKKALLRHGIDCASGYMRSFGDCPESRLVVERGLYIPVQYPLSRQQKFLLAETLGNAASRVRV